MTNITDIDELSKLEAGWDSYRAPAIDYKCIQLAKIIASILPNYEWQAIPTSDGGIQLEHSSMLEDIEINIYRRIPSQSAIDMTKVFEDNVAKEPFELKL